MKKILFLIVTSIALLQISNAQVIEIKGMGVLGTNEATLTFDDLGSIDHVVVEAAALFYQSTPANVTFSNGIPADEVSAPFQEVEVKKGVNVNSSNWKFGYYTAEFDHVDNGITLNKNFQGLNTPDFLGEKIVTFYAYIYRTDGSASMYSIFPDGPFNHALFYKNGSSDPVVYNFTLDAVDGVKDLEIHVPLSDNELETERHAVVTMSAGGDTDGTDLLLSLSGDNFIDQVLSLSGIPGNITAVTLEVYSPEPGLDGEEGDSFIGAPPVLTVDEEEEQDPGCTLTWGYWKTHADPTKKKYDSTWENVGGQEADFFECGQTYKEVMKTAVAGNAYYILAHQFIAVELNEFAGANMSDVQAAFDAAKELLETYCPEEIEGLEGDDPLRKQFVDWGEILDDFNMGEIGPGHCDDLEDLKSAKIVTDNAGIRDISVYPNPVRNVSTISFKSLIGGRVTVDLYNSLGQRTSRLMDRNVNEGISVNLKINSQDYNEGLYILRIRNGNAEQTSKIQITR